MSNITINLKMRLDGASMKTLASILAACADSEGTITMGDDPTPVSGSVALARQTNQVGQSRPPVPAKPDPAPEKAPEAPGEPKAPEIDNMTLNAAVKGAQGRGVLPDTIRAVFAKYGIKSSRDCPTDRRAELLTELNALKPEDLPA